MRVGMRTLAVAVIVPMIAAIARPAEQDTAVRPAPLAQGDETGEASSEEQPPSSPPAAPPSTPPVERSPAATAQPTPPGQWVYTQQYGWIWMPYADAYTYLPPDGYGEPYEYVYWPTYGWTWVVAPWVWGWGPWPFFGVHGAFRFAWFGHGWWRSPWHWHAAPGPFHPGFVFHGVRPAPPRAGPSFRGAPFRAAPPMARGFVRGGGGGVRGRGGHR